MSLLLKESTQEALNLRVLIFNMLHPEYALRHQTKQGIIAGDISWRSNWCQRLPGIWNLLESNNLDFALLQEVPAAFEKDILSCYPDARILTSLRDSKVECGTSIMSFGQPRASRNRLIKGKFGSTASIAQYKLENGKVLAICSIHLKGSADDESADYLKGVNDLGYILEELNQWSDIQIIGGDFNKNLLSPRSIRRLQLESAGFKSEFADYTDLNTKKTLDAMFYKGEGLDFIDMQVLDFEEPLSDHRPLIYEFQL